MPALKHTPETHPARWINYLYAALLCMLPFIYSDKGVDPVLLSRQIALGIFVIVGSVWLLFRFEKGQQLRSLLPFLFLALPVVYLVSMLQAINSIEAWYIVIKISLFCCFFLVIFVLIRQQVLTLKIITLAVAMSGVIATLWAIRDMVYLQHMGIPIFEGKNIYKVNASFGHKNLLSSYIFLCMPMLLLQWNFHKKAGWRILVVLGLILMLCVILLLQTRAVLLGFAVSMLAGLALLIFRFPFQKSAHKKAAILGMILCLLFAGLFLYVNRAKLNIITHTESFVERANLWHNTWQMIKENPVTGVGAANWQIHFPKYGIERFYEMNYTISEGLTTFQRPHNDFLWVWSETGIAGVLIYVGIFICSMLYAFRLMGQKENAAERFIYATFFLQLSSYTIISLVDFPLERIEHPVVIISSMAFVCAAYVPAKHVLKFNPGKLMWIVPVIVAGYSIFICSQRWKSELQLKKMYKAHVMADWQKLVKESSKAQTAYFNMDYYSVPVKWYAGVGLFMQNNIAAAKAAFEEAYELNPYQVHVLNNYGTCFEKEGNHQRAIELLSEAHRISPTFSDGIINLSGAYFNAGRYDDAYKTITQFKYDEYNDRFKTFALAIIKVRLEDMMKAEQNTLIKVKLMMLMKDNKTILMFYQQAQQSKEELTAYISAQLVAGS
jgi:O-antigen ligase